MKLFIVDFSYSFPPLNLFPSSSPILSNTPETRKKTKRNDRTALGLLRALRTCKSSGKSCSLLGSRPSNRSGKKRIEPKNIEVMSCCNERTVSKTKEQKYFQHLPRMEIASSNISMTRFLGHCRMNCTLSTSN